MPRLPIPGSDDNQWGTLLNEYLATAHNADGTLKLDVKTIADLKAVDVSTLTDKQQALVAGYHSVGDGGGGQFYYDAGASDADNGGTIFAPNSGSGRWLRNYTGALQARWFGARFNGASRSVSISAGSSTLSISTSRLEVGMVIFVPGAGSSGANLRGVISALGSGSVTLNTPASTTVSGVTAYVASDDTAALNAAITAATEVGVLELPYGVSLIEQPLNMALQSNGITLRGAARYRTAILANTGGVAIDMCGTSAARLESFRIYTVSQLNNPSTVGVALMRAVTRTIAAYCEFRRFFIEFHSNPTVNGGVGSIGFYNYGGEFNVHDTVVYKANLPVAIVNSNLYNIQSYYTDVITTGTSTTQTEFIGGNEFSARAGGNCMVISNAANVNVNAYFAKVEDESTEAAIKILGKLKTSEMNINVEHYGKVLDVQGETSRLRINGNVDYLISGTPWYDIKAKCRNCDFEMFPGGDAGGTSAQGVGEPLFSVSGSGKLQDCTAHIMLGRDTGLTEINGAGVRLRSELFSRVRARMNTTTPFPSLPHSTGSTTLINWDQEDWDDNNLFSGGQFTAPISGFYRVTGRYQLNLVAAAPGAELVITVNGSAHLRHRGRCEAGLSTMHIDGVVFAARGQTIDMRVRQDSGQASDTTGDFDGDAADFVIELL